MVPVRLTTGLEDCLTDPDRHGHRRNRKISTRSQRRSKKTLPLAGNHTTFRHHGTVHGAYLSGVEAARIIDDELWER